MSPFVVDVVVASRRRHSEFDKPAMIQVWTTRLTDLIHTDGKEYAADELHPGRYLHHTKATGGYKPLIQGLVDKADVLKVRSVILSAPTYTQNAKVKYLFGGAYSLVGRRL